MLVKFLGGDFIGREFQDRRAACAKAQRCGKAEFGVWGSRVMGALKAGVGRGQLRACTQETTEMSGWGMAMGPPPQMALA